MSNETEIASDSQETILVNQTVRMTAESGIENNSIKPGTRLNNRFDILEVLGQGGMGVVYKALDKRDIEAGNSTFIAIKVLNDDCKKDPQLLQSLYQETKKTQSLSHPNIVTVYDFDRVKDLVYMTMEFIEGAPLDKILSRHSQGVELASAIDIISQLGSALSYAHNKHIIHLDLKPSNIFFDTNQCIKILDFGIAQKLNSSLASNDTPTIPLALTPTYASVEMLEGKPPSASDDIYAFACICYELLTGKHPYNRVRATKALEEQRLPQKIKFLTKSQWSALKRALALEKKNRTGSIDQFLLEFNAQKSYLKYIFLGGALVLSSVSAYYYLLDNIDQTESTQVQNGEGASAVTLRDSESLQTPLKHEPKNEENIVNNAVTNVAIKETMEVAVETSSAVVDPTPVQRGEEALQGNIQVWTDQISYKIGSTLRVYFKVDRELYVQLYLINSVGEIARLFPNPYQQDNLLRPEINYQIPPENAEFTLDISAPKGKDRIIAVASSKQLPSDIISIDSDGEIIVNKLKGLYIQSQTTYYIE